MVGHDQNEDENPWKDVGSEGSDLFQLDAFFPRAFMMVGTYIHLELFCTYASLVSTKTENKSGRLLTLHLPRSLAQGGSLPLGLFRYW